MIDTINSSDLLQVIRKTPGYKQTDMGKRVGAHLTKTIKSNCTKNIAFLTLLSLDGLSTFVALEDVSNGIIHLFAGPRTLLYTIIGLYVSPIDGMCLVEDVGDEIDKFVERFTKFHIMSIDNIDTHVNGIPTFKILQG